MYKIFANLYLMYSKNFNKLIFKQLSRQTHGKKTSENTTVDLNCSWKALHLATIKLIVSTMTELQIYQPKI